MPWRLGSREIVRCFFKLGDDDHLTLFDLVCSRLPSAEFALISAFHTAELTDGSIADEALHLTAAIQYCGFWSVVGTMWTVTDIDGLFFYKATFSNGRWRGAPMFFRDC
jgi:CHAT domain-containing protein